MKDYLSKDEQYKETLNNEEISRIKNPELRYLRQKYWRQRHDAFLDEHGIPDVDLGKAFDRIDAQEKREIEAFRAAHPDE